MSLDLPNLRALATSHLTERWHGSDTVKLAEGVIALLDEIDRWKDAATIPAKLVQAFDEQEKQLAAMTAARDRIYQIAKATFSTQHMTAELASELDELRAVGGGK